jgi:hypothetical protein
MLAVYLATKPPSARCFATKWNAPSKELSFTISKLLDQVVPVAGKVTQSLMRLLMSQPVGMLGYLRSNLKKVMNAVTARRDKEHRGSLSDR